MKRQVVAFGSSTTEIFDYIFGDNPNYFSAWASGWSARGLRTIEISELSGIIEKFLNPVRRDANIFLVFGVVDCDFNAAFKAQTSGFYNYEKFVSEATEGILHFHSFLSSKLGFANIYPCFIAPPVDLDSTYWHQFKLWRQLPLHMRYKMYQDVMLQISSKVEVINCMQSLIHSEGFPACKKEFVRDVKDHHCDYIKVQDLVYSQIKEIDGMLEMRKPKYTQLYQHVPYGIDQVKKNRRFRSQIDDYKVRKL